MANLDLVALLHIFSKARLYKPICITTSSDVNLASLCMEVGQKSELDFRGHTISCHWPVISMYMYTQEEESTDYFALVAQKMEQTKVLFEMRGSQIY